MRGGAVRGWMRRAGRRHPLFAAALMAVVCVGVGGIQPAWGLAAGALCGLAGFWSADWRRGLAWLICGLLPLAGMMWREDSRRCLEQELVSAPTVRLRARLLEDARGSGGYWSAPAKVLDGGPAGARVWWEGWGKAPVSGAVVTARGRFEKLEAPRNPGEFDRGSWLRRQGVAAVFRSSGKGAVETGWLAELGARIRRDFRERVTAGLAEDSQEARVIRAVVIGEKPQDADALIEAFRNSGTLHVFSVSGLHVAMVGMIGWLALRWLGVPRRWAVAGLLPLIFGYAWITGNGAPAVRSAWMAAVFLGAFVFRRRPDLLNALGAVLLVVLLWDGRMLFLPGVQLSYGVVAAIAIGASWTTRWFSWMAKPELYLPLDLMNRRQRFSLWLRRRTAQSLGVSVAAGVGSAPLTALHFGLITPVSVIAGVVLVPLVFVLLAAALIAVAVWPIAPPVARAVNRVNRYVANGCVVAAKGFSAVPGGNFQLRGESKPMLLVYDLSYGAGAACFSGGNEGAVLIDCGDRYSFERRVVPSLRRLGIRPDSVVLSHPDGGHLGGGPSVWEAFPIRQVLLPVRLSRSPAFRAWAKRAPAAGVSTGLLEAGKSVPFPDGARLEVLHAPDPNALNAVADARVAIFRLHWRGWKLLFTSDAGMGAEMSLLDTGQDLAADVIIAGRNRGDHSLCDPFLDVVKPRVIVASNAAFPVEETLDPNTVDYWESRGIRVVDQAKSGGVTLRIDETGNLRIEGHLGAEPLVLSPR